MPSVAMVAAARTLPSGSDTGSPQGTIERIEFASRLQDKHALRIESGVLFLCRYSRLHAQYPAEMFERRIRPSLPLGQFHYYVDSDGVPAAFCNWVWLTAPVLEDVMTTGRDLLPREFNCGRLPFFYEFLAPFGHCRQVVRGLRELPWFKGRRVPAIRGESEDGVPHIGYFCF